MEFNEELAAKIAGEHNINPNTIKVWKSRGAIPDRYLRKGFEKTVELTADQLKTQQKLLKILKLPPIKVSGFAELWSYDTKYVEVFSGSSNFTPTEMERTFAAIKAIQLDMLKLQRNNNIYAENWQKKVFATLNKHKKQLKLTSVFQKIFPSDSPEMSQIRMVATGKRKSHITDRKIIDGMSKSVQLLELELRGDADVLINQSQSL